MFSSVRERVRSDRGRPNGTRLVLEELETRDVPAAPAAPPGLAAATPAAVSHPPTTNVGSVALADHGSMNGAAGQMPDQGGDVVSAEPLDNLVGTGVPEGRGRVRRRDADGTNDQTEERSPVVPEVSRRCVVGRIEQYRCDEEREGEFRRNAERRCAGNECEERTAEREKHRIGCAKASRCCGQQRGREDQTNENFETAQCHRVGRILADVIVAAA